MLSFANPHSGHPSTVFLTLFPNHALLAARRVNKKSDALSC